jgi:translation elongation factor EF-Tu-like GTPase
MGWWPFGRRERTEDRSVAALLAEADAASPTGSFRLTVEDVFTITGRGTVVTGRVETGALRVGQVVRVLRDGAPVTQSTVDGIEKFRATLDVARAGEQVGLLLRGVRREELARGDVLEG